MGHIVYQDDNGCPLPCVGCQWILQPDGSLKQEIVATAIPATAFRLPRNQDFRFAWMK